MALRRAVLIAGFLFVPAVALAQRTTTGTVTGRIVDANGGVLPGVTVTLKSPEALGAFTGVTDGVGVYPRGEPAPGDLRAPSGARGGQTVVRHETVRLGAVTQVDITMAVGSLSETITVKGESPIVDTERAGLSCATASGFSDRTGASSRTRASTTRRCRASGEAISTSSKSRDKVFQFVTSWMITFYVNRMGSHEFRGGADLYPFIRNVTSSDVQPVEYCFRPPGTSGNADILFERRTLRNFAGTGRDHRQRGVRASLRRIFSGSLEADIDGVNQSGSSHRNQQHLHKRSSSRSRPAASVQLPDEHRREGIPSNGRDSAEDGSTRCQGRAR